MSGSSKIAAMAVAVLSIVHVVLAVASSRHKSVTFDEVAHIGAGVLYWRAGDYRFNAESGILPQRWAALPLLVKGSNVDAADAARFRGNAWAAGREVLFASPGSAGGSLLAARTMIAVASACLGLLVFVWSRRLFGDAAGFVSLTLYTFSPTMLAHARLVTADLFVAGGFLAATAAIWWVLAEIRPTRVLVASLAISGLLLSKHSGLLILPIGGALAIVRVLRSDAIVFSSAGRTRRWSRPAERTAAVLCLAAVAALLCYALIWAAYGFRFAADPRSRASTFLHTWGELDSVSAAPIRWARDYRLLPEAYLWGLAYTLDTTRERDAFLRGQHRKTGWWWFFPYAFAIKTPPALSVLALLAVVAGHRRGGRDRRDLLERSTPLWILWIVYWGFSMSASLNIGHRHLLPIYPPMFILAGLAAVPVPGRWAAGLRTAAWVSVIAFVWESWKIHPHYLSYFNQLVGGPGNGYRHLVDSSLDWGQDLGQLEKWIERYRQDDPRTPIYVAYFGSAVPSRNDGDVRWIYSFFRQGDPLRGSEPLRGGVYCVSVTLLQSVHMEALGPWTEAREKRFRELEPSIEHFRRLAGRPEGRAELVGERPLSEWLRELREFDRLRSSRLFKALLQREPDARAGYSINIYRLTDQEVRHALDGPPPFEGS